MQNAQVIATLNTYQQLLHRYANCIVKNPLAAALIVEAVIDDYSKLVDQIPHTEIRSFLKNKTFTKCKQWNSAKVKI